MKNAITIQDEYIASVSGYDPKGRNYSVLASKAYRKAVTGFMEMGFSEGQSERLTLEAHDVANHERFLKAIIGRRTQ